MFQWLNENKEWLFGGLGAAIVIGLTKFFGTQFGDYLKQRLLRSLNEDFDNKFNERLREVFSESPRIFAEIDVDPDEVEFYCVTYRMNENKKMSYERTWIENDKFKIEPSRDGFALLKEDIGKRMKDPADPYKFYMKVADSPESINKYYLRLLQARHVVTGCGEPDDENNKWRIWFLLSSQPIHPYPTSPTNLNHTLVNQVFIRSSVFGANNQRGKMGTDHH